jgi:large subunit ribosomal protein L16
MRNRGLAYRGNKLSFGEFGLQSISHGRITSRQIESARKAINHHLKRNGKIWICVFPDKPITKKPLEVRMGKGKGSVEFWAFQVKPGKILYEISGVDRDLAREACTLAASKLSVLTKFVQKMAVL